MRGTLIAQLNCVLLKFFAVILSFHFSKVTFIAEPALQLPLESPTFTEREFVYDKNSNILSFERTANGEVVNDSTFDYNGNQRTTVNGNANMAYSYDYRGNITHDTLNNLDVSYNFLNLPSEVSRDGELLAKYSYLTDGTKLNTLDAEGNGFEYRGSLVYNRAGDALELESVAFSGGRILKTTEGYEPNYFITDHLGSVRVVVDGNGEVQQQRDYYPFGGEHPNQNLVNSDNRFLFSGKEVQERFGVGYYDFHARQYDPNGVIFMSVDPFAEKFRDVNPYAYCLNNPVKFLDFDGRQPGIAFKFPDVAAKNWGDYYNGASIIRGREMASSVYVDVKNGESVYIYTEPNIGGNDGVTPSNVPAGKKRVATIHSHGKYEAGYLNNEYSGNDKNNAHYRQADNYLATPDGSLKKYEYKTGRAKTLRTDLPSDPKDPKRKNNVQPKDVPAENQKEKNEQTTLDNLKNLNLINVLK